MVKTISAQWHTKPRKDHWYIGSTEFALEHLKGPGSCLCIGSPVFEAEALQGRYDLTYLDVRRPPEQIRNVVIADATSIPFPAQSFDAVSTACVLTHAGLGRYGDLVIDDGDELMLSEIARVMKPEAIAAVTFGGVIDADLPVRVGNMHRIYTIKEAERMCLKARLKIQKMKVWSTLEAKWVEKPTKELNNFDYLSVLVNVAAA